MRALTRAVPDSIQRCELTHVERVEIDLPRARAQHAAYEQALIQMGCDVQPVPPAMDMPDSVFIEDTAIVFDEVAVITRPGIASRQRESAAVAAALAQYRELAAISSPATLDGGDVLCVGRDVFVGISGRSNGEAARQLAELIAPHGYRLHPIRIRGCLHVKSAVTCAADDLLVLNPDWVDAREFAALRWIAVDPAEPSGANVLRAGDVVLCAASAPGTAARLEDCGLRIRSVDVSELAKAEGALTCCSLLIR